MTNLNLLANTTGILALFSSTIVLLPTLVHLFKIKINYKKALLNLSYFSLLSTITLGLIHGLLMTQSTNIDFYNLDSYWIYMVGIFTLNIFIFFAFNFSEIKLTFKRLNYINYAALFLLACHVGQKIMP